MREKNTARLLDHKSQTEWNYQRVRRRRACAMWPSREPHGEAQSCAGPPIPRPVRATNQADPLVGHTWCDRGWLDSIYSWEWIDIQNPIEEIQLSPTKIKHPSSLILTISLQHPIQFNPTPLNPNPSNIIQFHRQPAPSFGGAHRGRVERACS